MVLGQLPTGDNSPLNKNKAQLLPTRTTIPRTTRSPPGPIWCHKQICSWITVVDLNLNQIPASTCQLKHCAGLILNPVTGVIRHCRALWVVSHTRKALYKNQLLLLYQLLQPFIRISTWGPFTLAKTKIKKTWVFCCTVYTARKTHNIRGFWHEKRMREKTRISYFSSCVLVSGAHARLLSTFDRTRVVRIMSRAAVWWFRWRSHTTWQKTRIIPARLEWAFTLAKNQWNFGGVSKNHAAEVGFSIRVFWSV